MIDNNAGLDQQSAKQNQPELSVVHPKEPPPPPESEKNEGKKLAAFAQRVKNIGGTARDRLAAIAYESDYSPGREFLLTRFNQFVERLQRAEKEPQKLEMETYGNMDVLALLRGELSKEDPTIPETQKRKLMVLLLGGGQSGIIGAGVVRAMEKAGVLDTVDGFIGGSAGSCAIPCIATRTTEQGAQIYLKNAENNNFVKLPKGIRNRVKALWDLYRHGSKKAVIDTEFVCNEISQLVDPRIDMIKNCHQELKVIVMDTATGRPMVVDLKTLENPMQAIRGSTCVPGASTLSSVELNGKQVADGAYAKQIPLQEAFLEGATDVLIIANSPLGQAGGVLSDLQAIVMAQAARGYGYNNHVRQTISDYDQRWNEQSRFVNHIIQMNNPNRRVAVMAPKKSVISPIEDRKVVLEDAFSRAESFGQEVVKPQRAMAQAA